MQWNGLYVYIHSIAASREGPGSLLRASSLDDGGVDEECAGAGAVDAAKAAAAGVLSRAVSRARSAANPRLEEVFGWTGLDISVLQLVVNDVRDAR